MSDYFDREFPVKVSRQPDAGSNFENTQRLTQARFDEKIPLRQHKAEQASSQFSVVLQLITDVLNQWRCKAYTTSVLGGDRIGFDRK